jgi:hypothetical protein
MSDYILRLKVVLSNVIDLECTYPTACKNGFFQVWIEMNDLGSSEFPEHTALEELNTQDLSEDLFLCNFLTLTSLVHELWKVRVHEMVQDPSYYMILVYNYHNFCIPYKLIYDIDPEEFAEKRDYQRTISFCCKNDFRSLGIDYIHYNC